MTKKRMSSIGMLLIAIMSFFFLPLTSKAMLLPSANLSSEYYALSIMAPSISTSIAISNCYDSNGTASGGTSQVEVQVVLSWQEPIAGETITVTVPGAAAPQSVDPNVATVTNPTILYFTVPTATATSGNVTAAYSATTSVAAPPQAINIPASDCVLVPCEAGNTGGQVFNDFDGDGLQGSLETNGIANVTVTAYYDNGGTLGTATTTTDAAGQYSFSTGTGANQIPSGSAVRLEFSNLPAGLFPTAKGTNSATSVQFFTAPACDIDMGASYPYNYCQADPNVVVPSQVNGKADGSTMPALNVFANSSTGKTTPNNTIANSVIGSTWGEAYQRSTKRLFISAFTRRHSGFGPENEGGIYVFDASTVTPTLLTSFDLNGMPAANGGTINLGTVDRTAGNVDTELGASNTANIDLDAFAKVAKTSFGDADLSPDGQTLWITNLYENKLISVDVSGATLPGAVNQYPIVGAPTCTGGGSLHIFGLGVYQDKMYVGAACDDAQVAYVLEFDPNNPTSFTTVLTIPLQYYREGIGGNGAHYWQPWTDTWMSIFENQNERYPHALVSGIAFAEDGSMVIGLMDRHAYQLGYKNRYAISGNTSSNEEGLAMGDILYAKRLNGMWVLEGTNPTLFPFTDPTPYGGQMNNDGINGQGEYFWNDYFADFGFAFHDEISTGAVAVRPGSGIVMNSVLDPNDFYSQGIQWYNNGDRSLNNAYRLVENNGVSSFAKAAGLGDIELLCNQAPLEIGNRVWNDIDGDGVQDPSETGIDGITVEIYNGTTLVGTVVTANGGQWYFNNSNVTLNGAAGLLPNTAYTIRVPSASFPSGQFLTSANTGSGSNTDLNDNDAALVGSNAEIAYTTGSAGQNNHTLDIGFRTQAPEGSVGNYVWLDTNNDGLQNEPASNGINGVTVELWDATSNTLVGTTTTANDGSGNPGYYNFVIATNGDYYIKFPTTSGTNVLTTQTTTAATDGNSDANTSSGQSPVFSIDINGTGTAKDNPTIDAGYYLACNLTATANNNQSNVSCNGGSNGSTTAIASGNIGAVTYLWSNGATTATISGLTAGDYTVTITKTPTCTATASATITQPSALSLTCSKTDITTNGGSDGTASVSASGGTSPYAYAWSSGETTASISGKTSGTYTVTVTDNNGCTAACSSTINEPGCNLSATANNNQSNISCNGGSDGTTTAIASGNTGAVTYLWSNGTTTATISGLTAGDYTVTITETPTCTATASVTITQPTALSLTCDKTDVTTNGGSDGTASVSATGGTSPYTYAWDSGETTASISSKAAGTYTVTVTDNNGCTAMCSSTINEPGCNLSATANNNQSNVSCNGGSDGTTTAIASGNIGAVTYLWSNGATTATISGLTAGDYTVTITETPTCTATASVTITQPTALSLTCDKTDVTTNGGSDGTASVSATGGTSPYTYLWTGGATTSSISGKTSGTYTVTVTDNNGCTTTCSSTINEPGCNLSATANNNQSNVSCNGGSDGATTAIASGNIGAVTYLWSNGETTATISGLTAGDYTVTITETPTCIATASVTITQPTALSLTCDKTDVTTNGGSDGTASVSATGGTSPYTYSWSSGETTASISGKTSGTYIVTVTDDNGCTATCSSTINEPNAPIPPDLSLTKTANTTISTIGGTVIFTLTLTNDNGVDATGVVVTDYLPAGVTFVSTSDPANATLVGNNVVWNVGTFLGTDAPKTLTITVTANAEGSFVNNTEITATNEGDADSTPNNDVTGEDDQAQACFSVPVSLCSDNPTASITVTATAATSYQWYVSTDNGATYTALSGETAQTLVINNALMGGNGITKYFKVAYNGADINAGCGQTMCCPIIVTTQTCVVCPPPKCLTITVTKH